MTHPKILLFLVAVALGGGVCPSFSRADPSALIDLTRSPDYQQLSRTTGDAKLSALRDALGEALIRNWKPAQSGHPGASGQETFAAWVDLYQWLDLLESPEPALFERWLPPHLHVVELPGQTPPLRIGVIQPGNALSHDAVPAALLRRLASDSSFVDGVTRQLVAQPFTPGTGVLGERLDPGFIAATISDTEFLKRWSECFSKDDFAPRVLLNLESIWKGDRADWHEFLSLALAIAVVRDQPAPVFWPHSQVAPGEVPRRDAPPDVLFSEWVQAFRMGKLRMDPRQLGVGDLKFVVDAPLDAAEFDWVRNNPSLTHLDPARAFGSITYDQGRVIKDVYVWPWGEYRLSQIKEHGGICVDQAYYAAITGKALGIPTLFFCGEGRDGGHAWVGYLKGPEHWDLNVARYAGENYATGIALDPQSWAPITDHDLELLTRHLGNQDAQDAARRDLVIAADFHRKGDSPGEGRALESALQVCPENPVLWDAKEEWLVRTGAPLSDLKAHHEAAIAQFGGFSDLKTQHQQALVRLALNSGEKESAAQLSEDIVHENGSGWGHDARTDLSASAAWSLISSKMQEKDGDGALEEYERQLHLQGAQGGGDFFYRVVSPLASELMGFGRNDLALRVLKEAHQTLNPSRDSLVDRDLRKLWTAAGGRL